MRSKIATDSRPASSRGSISLHNLGIAAYHVMSESEKNAGADPKPELPAKNNKEHPPEVGGRKGPEPTRYGDWEKNGRAIDF